MPSKSGIQYPSVQEQVHRVVKKKVVKSIVKYLKEANPTLWGMNKPRHFLKKSIYLAIYKDITSKGYMKLASETKTWLGISHKSIAKNTRVIRKFLGLWGKEKIQLGTVSIWNSKVRNSVFKSPLENVNLWIDSSDLPLEGKRKISKKDPSWSFKCNSPGRRYMFLLDGKGGVRKLWGGYSPKIYDGTFLELEKEWFEKELNGAVVVGDITTLCMEKKNSNK